MNKTTVTIAEAYGRIGENERQFDIAYWQAQGAEAIFQAALELVVDAMLLKEGHAEQLPDFAELLSIFTDHNVRYLIVGGYAVMWYSEPRYTKDVDIWVATDTENAQAVFTALKAFGAPLAGLSPKDFTEPGCYYQMGKPPLRVDIMLSIPGVDFEAAYARRENANVAGVSVCFISKDDLIVSKNACGRPQDLLDVEQLLRAKR